jgi:hypothetical protein
VGWVTTDFGKEAGFHSKPSRTCARRVAALGPLGVGEAARNGASAMGVFRVRIVVQVRTDVSLSLAKGDVRPSSSGNPAAILKSVVKVRRELMVDSGGNLPRIAGWEAGLHSRTLADLRAACRRAWSARSWGGGPE